MKLTPQSAYTDIVLAALQGKKFNSVLEVGSGTCQNLKAIQEKYDVTLKGMDLGTAVQYPGIEVKLFNLLDDEWPYQEKFDVVFTMATLILMAPKTTEHWMKKLIEITKDYLIFIEIHQDNVSANGEVSGEYTTRNYKKLLKKYTKNIEEITYPASVWPGLGLVNSSIIIGQL